MHSEPGDPERPDPSAFTQPLSTVTPVTHAAAAPVEVEPIPAALAAKQSKPSKPPYAPAFGNLTTYAFARFAALVIDFGAIPFVFAAFAFDLADRGTLAFAPRTGTGFAAIAALALAAALVVAMLFETIFETTLGKALFGLGVRRGTGQHAGLQRIVVRYVLLPIDLVVVGEVLALVTRRHQRIGDFAAGTVVARHRIGGFATALALALLVGLIYAQATIGGGLSSVLAVTAEGTYFAPSFVGNVLATLGYGAHAQAPSAIPTEQATAEATGPEPTPTT